MSTELYIAHGLYAWTLELEDGTVRHTLASSLQSVVNGVFPSPVVSATRGLPTLSDAPPVLTTLTPSSAVLGSPSFTLHVAGTGFREGQQIIWNGSPEPTVFVSPTELTTEVNMATAEVAVTLPVAVRTLSGQMSNELAFEFEEAAETQAEPVRAGA